MRLSAFIRDNKEQIIAEWEAFAMTLVADGDDKSSLTLRDHIAQILTFVTNDIDTPQSGSEQINKSHGKNSNDLPKPKGEVSAAETHADLRLAGGFNLDQMVSEYRALRASIIKLWSAQQTEVNSTDILDLTRFNESIDQTMTESISYYTKKLNHSQSLFLAILSHDLRNPLGAISGSTQLVQRIGPLNERQSMLMAQVSESMERVNEIIGHLLDLTRVRFGTGILIQKAPMDFDFVSRRLVEEMRAAYPQREIILNISGDMKGEWDKARIGQVFSNLIGNAIQYSFKDTPINVAVIGDGKSVVLSVHNQGVPIPADKAGRLFDALTRSAANDDEETPGTTNLGLGLYITKEIVVAHGGTIKLASTEEDGTTFTARFPRSI